MMWAGVTDGHVMHSENSTDEYTPLCIALFKTKKEALAHFQTVVRIDADKMLSIEDDGDLPPPPEKENT